ncbi:CBK_G0011430.mRNA.1.CDS.1 [Saccharomyces cerevisiae]|nr:CBK_G0011430.mRNA.1.CDS.1 [Saccharomyces cerevisiae]CAI7215108.1 CBK_G0011430.mRNA.1.CDS.1 [Saccharomyces cerevisiae]
MSSLSSYLQAKRFVTATCNITIQKWRPELEWSTQIGYQYSLGAAKKSTFGVYMKRLSATTSSDVVGKLGCNKTFAVNTSPLSSI